MRDHLVLLTLATGLWLFTFGIVKLYQLIKRSDPKCQVCHGSGTLTNFAEDGRKINPDRHVVRTCEACNGAGEVDIDLC